MSSSEKCPRCAHEAHPWKRCSECGCTDRVDPSPPSDAGVDDSDEQGNPGDFEARTVQLSGTVTVSKTYRLEAVECCLIVNGKEIQLRSPPTISFGPTTRVIE